MTVVGVMGTRIVDRIEDWESRPFSGGYRGLQDLADEGFSGVVVSGLTRLCLLNGNVVGVIDGTVEDFEDADGTAYEAPSPALPLLATMQERTDEVRAKYYTEETPLEEVDTTLEQGGFTGFVVLSENVLSGDYYLVYHQGRSMAVAFVGNSERLLTDDEAFDRAADEVGIYEVRPVDIEVLDVPEPTSPDPEPDDGAASVAGAAAVTEAEDEDDDGSEDGASAEAATDAGAATPTDTDDGDTDGAAESEASASPESEPAADTGAEPSADAEADEPAAAGASSGTDRTERASDEADTAATETADASQTPPVAEAESEPTTDGSASARDTKERAGKTQHPGKPTESTPDDGAEQRSRSQQQSARRENGGPGREKSSSSGNAAATGGLERRTIPSLDPERTSTAENETTGERGGAQAQSQTQRRDAPATGAGATEREQAQQSQPSQESQQTQRAAEPASEPDPEPAEPATPTPQEGRVAELEAELESRSEELETVEARAERLASERDDLQAERDELAARVEQLEAEIERLKAQSEAATAGTDGRAITPDEAIEGTNLFVRYQSKGESTLETAHSGPASREQVNSNLRIEYHTQFEDDAVTVGEDPFDAFLEDAIEYRFVAWAVRELLFEIRDTGHESALSDLFDGLPKVDRADLNGSVSVQYEEEGETHRSQESFDVVLRDRMGNPLIVADINDARDAATQGMMESLVTRATRVGESNEQLAGAFLVTSSFFEPEALETAAESTSGGLLSRDKRESFVKLSRKQGYHLCLVEARNRKFHMAVPEL